MHIKAPRARSLQVSKPKGHFTRRFRQATPARGMVARVVLRRDVKPPRIEAPAQHIGQRALKHAAPPFGCGAKGHTRIQQADCSRVEGLTCKVLDPGFVGSALQHIDVPALLKPVPQAFPERQGGGQLNNPIRILKERSIAGFARETVIELQRLEVSKRSGGAPRGAQREEARSLPIGSGSSTRNPLAKGPGQLGRKACSRLAHAGLAAKNLSSRGYAPFTADLQVSLRHTAGNQSYKSKAG